MKAVLAFLCLIPFPQERAPGEGDIDAWIGKLGDPDAAVRNLAGSRLEALTLDLISAIHLLAAASPARDEVEIGRRERVRAGWRAALGGFIPADPSSPGPAGSSTDLETENRALRRGLRTQRITFDMSNAPLTAIVDLLREKTGINIRLADDGRSEDLMISVKAADETPDSILRRMLKPRAMAYTIHQGMVLIISAGQLRRRVRLELYDVQDLTIEQEGEELIDRIVKELRPDQWEESDGKSIQFQNGLLIVRNTALMHAELRKFLQELHCGVAKAPEPPPRHAILATVRELAGPAHGTAEARLSALGRNVAHMLAVLAPAGGSEDLEVRLRAQSLREAATRALGEEPTRRFLELAQLQGLVREIRAMWLHDTDFEDFEAEARSAFGSKAAWLQLIPRIREGEDLFTPPVARALWQGEAAVFVEQGLPMSLGGEERGKILVFTLPQDAEERRGDEGPACVVLKLAR